MEVLQDERTAFYIKIKKMANIAPHEGFVKASRDAVVRE